MLGRDTLTNFQKFGEKIAQFRADSEGYGQISFDFKPYKSRDRTKWLYTTLETIGLSLHQLYYLIVMSEYAPNNKVS